MDPNTQAPDQQAATGVPAPPAPMSQGGLIDALRSRGTMPSMLAQSMNQQGNAPSPGLAMGSGVLNALSGQNAALNPYLQQHQAQQNAQVNQALQHEELQSKKLDQQMRSNELAWKITQGMIDSGDEQGLKEGWANRVRMGKDVGVQISPLTVQGLSRGKITKEQIQRMVSMFDAGQMPEDIGRVTGFSPDIVKQGMQIAESDGARRIYGVHTRSEAEAGKAKDQQEQIKLAREEFGFTDPKDPRIPFISAYTLREFGVPFNKATHEERLEAVGKSDAVARKEQKLTASVRNAMAEFNPMGDINNPKDVESAMIMKRSKEQKNKLEQAAVTGQLSVVGREYSGELSRMTQQIDKVGQLDMLINDMDRLVLEGRKLGLTNNASTINYLQQEYVRWTASGKKDKLSEGAEWYRAFDTLNARFATVAQAVEQITGNRLAVSQTTRALGFHPRQSDPYSVQQRIVEELRSASRGQRDLVAQNIKRADERYSAVAGKVGVPFVLGGAEGGGHEVESVEEEK